MFYTLFTNASNSRRCLERLGEEGVLKKLNLQGLGEAGGAGSLAFLEVVMGCSLESGSELHHWVPFSLESLVVLTPTEVCSLNPAVHGMVANVPKYH